ncbi:MAG: hypothetical protein GXP31_00700 [Kiritimatiellaeota bacterium]|nr:hypothetical protein [Kiritimatiellota bacterium]
MADDIERESPREKEIAPAPAGPSSHPILRGFAKFAVGCLLVLAGVWFGGFLLAYWTGKVNGFHTLSPPVSMRQDDVQLLFDLTGADPSGARILNQEIFDSLLELVRSAGDTIVLDMFLVDAVGPDAPPPARKTMQELVGALVRKKKEAPDTWVLVITDPINTAYRLDRCPESLRPLVEAGGRVILTDLDQVGDSNLLYSPFYRAIAPLAERIPFLGRHGVTAEVNGIRRSVTPLQILRLLNFKANHRKTAVIKDRDGKWHALVSSANPHEVGSASSNAAVRLTGGPSAALFANELEIARSSLLRRPEGCFGADGPTQVLREIETRLERDDRSTPERPESPRDAAVAQLCTEGAIGEKLDWMLDGAGAGDRVDILMFYLADPGVLRRIRGAAARGARVRLLLDPNRRAFGRGRHGIPNRPAAAGLVRWAGRRGRDLQVRWFVTQEEQAHFKLIHIYNPDLGRDQILCGSANFTRRNLRDENLEADVFLDKARAAGKKCTEVFDKLWENTGDMVYSSEFERFAPKGARKWLGRVALAWGNLTGACTY